MLIKSRLPQSTVYVPSTHGQPAESAKRVHGACDLNLHCVETLVE